MKLDNFPEVMTVKQLADAVQISDVTVKRALKSGELEGFKAGRDWRVTREAAEVWLGTSDSGIVVKSDTSVAQETSDTGKNIKDSKEPVKIFAGVRVEEYTGDSVPVDAVQFGSVFFADGVGFGIVYVHAAGGIIVKGRTASGSVAFIKDVENQTYSCFPRISREEHFAQSGQSEDSEEREADVYLGKAVPRIVFLGVLPIPQAFSEDGGFVDGFADFNVVDGLLRGYIADYEHDYRPHVRSRRVLEYLYNQYKDSDKAEISEGAESFDPTKCDYLCSVLVYDEVADTAMYYRNPHSGKFYSCVIDAEFMAVSDETINAIRLLNAVFETERQEPEFEYRVNHITADILTDAAAEKALRGAVREGRMSAAAFAKYFGAYAGQLKQIAARIPLSLKMRMDMTGLTIERLLELGCDAHLASVGEDFKE